MNNTLYTKYLRHIFAYIISFVILLPFLLSIPGDYLLYVELASGVVFCLIPIINKTYLSEDLFSSCFSYLLLITAIALAYWFMHHIKMDTLVYGNQQEYFSDYYYSIFFIIGLLLSGTNYGVFKKQRSFDAKIHKFLIAISLLLIIFITIVIIAIDFFHNKNLAIFNLFLNYPNLLGSIFGFAISIIIMGFNSNILIPSFSFFREAKFYIKILVFPVIGYFFGIFMVSVFFSGIYWAINFYNHYAFSRVFFKNHAYDYLFYSISVMLDMGDMGVILPEAQALHWATLMESVVSLIWTTIVLAGTLAYVHDKIQVRKRMKKKK